MCGAEPAVTNKTMKKIAILSLLSILFIACGQGEKQSSEIEPGKQAIVSTASNSAIENPAENTAAQDLPDAMIKKPIEIEFEAGSLPSDWQKTELDGGSRPAFGTKDGVLKLRIPAGADLFGSNQSAPRLLRPISGDFEFETKIKFDPQSNYQGAGILVWNNDKNYLRFERGFGGVDGGESGVRFDKSVGGDYSSISGTEQNPSESKEIELKLMRKGKEFIAFMRENIDGEWKEIGFYITDYPETVKVGIIGVSTAGEITAEFEYIRIMPILK